MKKVLCLFFSIVLLLCGCTLPKSQKTLISDDPNAYYTGVWFSFSEINTMLMSGNFKSEFDIAVDNCKNLGITDAFIHVCAFCSSLYDSEYYPELDAVKQYDFDVFGYMTEKLNSSGIRTHAWINPYRVRTSDCDISLLDKKSPAYKWLNDTTAENDNNICVCSGGIYLNPASYEVRQLVINGIREIINKYSVDGIHFDDYFYPTVSEEFDSASYEEYCGGNTNPLSLADWRRANVNALISGCYTAIKFMNKDIVFSISPAADIDKNYNEYYADIASWTESGCVDWIIPQLYFGFDYPDEDFRFENLLSRWENTISGGNTKILVGLAAYKIATDSAADAAEWGTRDDILSRQAEICRKDKKINGHIFFSYSSLFSENDLNSKSREKLKP